VDSDTFTGYGPEDPPTVNGQTFTPAYGGSQAAVSFVELFMMGLEFAHYNTPLDSGWTGANAQGFIPVLHHNESGVNIIPGVAVYNNTGMYLNVPKVRVNGTTMAISGSPFPNGSVGAVKFAYPVKMPTQNISVVINFQVIQDNGNLFGYGQIRYNGPNFYPPSAP